MTRQQIERAQYAVKVLHNLETSPPASDGRVQRLLDSGHAAVWNAYQNALTKEGAIGCVTGRWTSQKSNIEEVEKDAESNNSGCPIVLVEQPEE